MMDEKYWDRMAVDYEGEIFSVLANDRDDLIVNLIRRYSSEKNTACDFGCGVGKFLPQLSENFKHVHAIDLSEKLLKQARDKCSDLENISFYKKDLANDELGLGAIDFGLCVNVAIMSEANIREAIFKSIWRHLRKEGHLVLVVPSLESALYADFRLVQWNRSTGLDEEEATWELKEADENGHSSLRKGIVEIDGEGTKHYLREEVVTLFEQIGFEIEAIEKVEYRWDSEFDKPPEWMGRPYPWDWLAVLKKN